MNTTVVMNNLLNLIQSMALTTSNKQWLADHLYEEIKAESEQRTSGTQANDWPKVRREDMVISEEVANMFHVNSPLPEDFDEKKAYVQYLYEKYK